LSWPLLAWGDGHRTGKSLLASDENGWTQRTVTTNSNFFEQRPDRPVPFWGISGDTKAQKNNQVRKDDRKQVAPFAVNADGGLSFLQPATKNTVWPMAILQPWQGLGVHHDPREMVWRRIQAERSRGRAYQPRFAARDVVLSWLVLWPCWV
jgi:hypothetical protein